MKSAFCSYYNSKNLFSLIGLKKWNLHTRIESFILMTFFYIRRFSPTRYEAIGPARYETIHPLRYGTIGPAYHVTLLAQTEPDNN